MPFDYEAAKRAGYTDAEIADYLSEGRMFNAAAAREAGYSDAEIVEHLQTKEAQRASRDVVARDAKAPARPAPARATQADADRVARGTFGTAAPELDASPTATALRNIKPENPVETYRRERNTTPGHSISAPEPVEAGIDSIAHGLANTARSTNESVQQMITDAAPAPYLNQTQQDVAAASQMRDLQQAQGRADRERPQFDSAIASGVYGGMESVLQQLPGIVASVAVGNPAPALAWAGGTTGTQAYGKYRARGGTPGEAALGGIGEGAVEVATELLPMGKFIEAMGGAKGAKSFFTQVAKSVRDDVIGEQIATAAQDAIDTAIANPDKTWDDYLAERPNAALQTLVATITQGGIMAGGGYAVHRAMRTIGDDGRLSDRPIEDGRIAAPGVRQSAETVAATPTQADIDSPLDTGDIVAGRAQIAKAEGSKQADSALQQHGLPTVGSRVVVDMGDGQQQTGSMEDWFEQEDGKGVVIKLDNGKVMREFTDTLADAGVSIRTVSPLEEADALDAQLAEQAAAPVLPAEGQSSPVPTPATSAAPAVGNPRTGAVPSIDSYMAKTRGAESGGNDSAKNPRSSAAGRYQFTDGTWLAYYKEEFGDDGKSPAQILALKGDPAMQDRLMRRLTKDNAAALTRAGHDVTDGNLYLAHFAGSGGANALLNANPNASAESVLGAKAIAANPFLKGKTAGEVVAWAATKMGGVATPGSTVAEAPAAKPADIAFSTPDFGDVKPVEVASPEVRGEKIDAEFTAFHHTSGTLGIPRAEMPQIAAEHRGAMVNFLNARGVTHEEMTVPAASLKPTQAEFSEAKVEKAKGFTGGDRAILVSSDGYVLDGHHQWMAARDQGGEVRAIRLDAPIADLINTVRDMPSATTEAGEKPAEVPADAAPAAQPATDAAAPAREPIVTGDQAAAPSAPTTESSATFEVTPSGNGFAVLGASPAEIAAIAAAVPKAKASQRKDGAQVYSAKYADEIRAAVAGVSQNPASTEADEHPGLVIRSLQTGKETTIQPKGTVAPAKPTEAPRDLEDAVLALDGDGYLRYLDALQPPRPSNRGAITSRAVQIQHQFGTKGEAAMRAALDAAKPAETASTPKEDASDHDVALDYDSSERHERVGIMRAAGVTAAYLAGGPERNSGTPFDQLPRGVQTLVGAHLIGKERTRRATQRDAERQRKMGAPVGTAPEHAQVGVDDVELAQIVQEFNEAQAIDQDVTHVFDPPKKGEIVRLADKAKVYHAQHGWMTPAEARAKIDEWKAHAAAQGTDRKNSDKIVLSLFDLTGKWSQPWEEAGYQVYRFDIQDDPEVGDVHNFSTEFFGDWFGDFDELDVYAILAACPCTDFASSGARHFAAKDADGRTVASVKLVHKTLATIEYFKPAVWAIENPVGRIEKLGGLPPFRLSFDPNQVGEDYTKKTLLWGRFNADLPIAPTEATEGSKMHAKFGGKSMATKNARSATPEGFAYSFFMANNAIDHPAMAIANKYDRLDRGLIERAVKAGVTADQIDQAVEDFYYQDLDDDAANDAIRALSGDTTPPAPKQLDLSVKGSAAPKPTKAEQLAELQAMKDRGEPNGAISVAAERMPDVLQVDLMKVLGMDVDKALADVSRSNAAPANSNQAKPSKNRLVTDERAADLRERLKAKLNPNRLNSGIDPEVLAIGTELAVYHIEKGARRFAALARAVAADLEVPLANLRTYLRGWYNGARDMMEDHGESVAGMDDSDEVAKAMRTFDQWAQEPVTPPAANGTRNRDAELSDSLSAGDARPGAEDVSRASQDGRDDSPSGREGRGSAQAVQPVDGERGAASERGARGSATGSSSDRAGLRDADNLPAERSEKRGTGSAADAVTGTDWAIEPGSLAEDRAPAQKARDNVDAIALVKQIEREGRPATRAEQAKIARYVGWGGLKNAFPDSQGEYGKGFEKIGPELRALLSDAEYETARRSIQYAHYTGETVVRAMWDIAERLGFRGGSVFEPGMGTGNFRGMMPSTIAGHYNGLEYDHLTASIAKLLYPQSGVQQADYTRTPQLMDVADLVIGNPPFSETTVSSDPAYATQKFVLHDFFFAKSLDAVKPGGLLMFVTSAGTMNKVGDKARAWLADRADLVGAIRLPGNTFEKNAGTSVTTDIVILRKRAAGEPAGDRSWVETVNVPLQDRDGNTIEGSVNRYFVEHPEMVLGEQGMFDKLVAGPRYAVRAPAGFDLGAALKAAADRLPAAILHNAPKLEALHSTELDFSSSEKKDGSYYVDPDGRLMQYRNGVGRAVQSPGKGVTGGMSAAAQERVRGLVPVRDALRDVYAADVKDDVTAGDKAREKLNKAYDAFVAKFGPINKTDLSYRAPSSVQLESARAEQREEARLAGADWEDGSFDIEPYLQRGASITEIARDRKAAREAAIAAGRPWSEGTFDPESVPETVIEKRPNLDPFIEDEESYRLAAIEHYNKDTGEAVKGKAFYENAVRLDRKPTINSAQDALLYSLNRLGRPDIGVIADMAGKSRGEVLEELHDQLFEVPGQAGAYETAETYLSGNVREKLALAQAEAKRNPALARNVKALEAALPAPLTPSEIAANLGMPWIPTADIERFATEHMGLQSAKVKYLPKLAQWTAAGDTYSAAARSTWGTARVHAMDLLEAALNRQTPTVRDRTEDGKSVINAVATQAAQDKMAEIKAAFRQWIWQDEDRADRLTTLYNENYNSLVAPKFDGSYLTTPGIASGWEWRPHQRAVIARIIQAGNTYMAHEVGAGKTSAMIGAGMEMKRLGLVSKPMYVVPNHMLGQFTKEFYEQYPLAKIRVADETRFHTSRRKEFVARMAADDLDAVIITHSAFGYIPMSDDFTAGMIEDQIAELVDLLGEIGKDQDQRITRRKIEQQKEQLEQRLRGLTNRKRDQVFTFEETGVDFLFVDEAHLFRKLDFSTKMGNVKGIDPNGSQMSFDLYAKTRHLEDVHPGRNLVLASGTPITNTMAELYSLSRYLQQAELDKRGLGHFDAWAGAFGDTVTSLEQDPAGGYKPVTRFAQFVNVPELSVMARQVMDVVGAAELRQYVTLPTLKGGSRQMVLAEQTDSQAAYQEDLKARMEAIRRRSGPPQKGDDILLSVIGDGRKSAIDYRLIDAEAPRERGSKLEKMIDNVAERYKEFARTPFHTPGRAGSGFSEKPVSHGRATQMIFSDFGINGAFPVHKYIKQQLIQRGIPAAQVAIISDFKTHVAKQRLFNDMNEGKVAVLIGSVAKMGTGVNAQKRLRALHNMDAQWYPANDTQRNGRIIRQGNMNPEIEILDYSTKGTYDSQMWNLMAKKAKFIEGFMRGDPTMRDMEDLGEASQYEQAQAMTTSDPRVMELTEWKQDLEKLERRKIGHEREKQQIRGRIASARQDIEDATNLVPLIEADIAKRVLPVGDEFTAKAGDQTLDDRAEFGAALLEAMDNLIARSGGKQDREGVGELGGFALVAEAHAGIDGPVASIIIKRAGGRETAVRSSEDSRGLVTKLVNALKKFDSELAYEKSRIERAEREIADYTPRLSTKFDGGPQIEELRGKITGMEAALDSETKAREAAAKADQPTEVPKDSIEDEDAKDRVPGAGDTEALWTDLRERLAKLGLADRVTLNVVERLSGRAEGRYWPGRRVVEVALGARDAGFVLDHEAIHALRDMGVFTQTDWKILTTAARNTPDLWLSVQKRYAGLPLAAREEEAVADLFGRYQRGDFAAKGMVERLFIRLVKVLAAIRNALRGQGFTTPRTFYDVLGEVASGEAATREGQGEAGRAFVPAFGRKGASTSDEAKFSIPERDDMVALGGSGGTWSEKMGDAFDRWRTAAQDRYLPLLKVQREIEVQTGKSLPPSRDPYMAEELMTGRIGSRLEKLAEDHVGPLFDAMHEDGVTVDELETYLYARHAPERNARMAALNPEMQEGEGSGMTDLEARAVMNRIRREGKMEAMERLAPRVDRMIANALDYRVETGLMSEEQAKEWRDTYEHYIPLRGFKETGGDPIPERMNRSGGGINVRGRESKAAYGRRSKADSPLAYIIMQAEEAIVRGETNRVAQKFVALAKANPDPDFWAVNKVSAKRRINEDSGLVETYLSHNLAAEDADWTVSAKIDGKEVRVTLNKANVAARRLADSMKNLTQHQLDWITLHLGKVNRFLSAVNTSYNPEFIITNAFRDVQTAAFNLAGEDVKKLTRGVLKDYPAALKASTKGAFGKHDGEWGQIYDEFVANGGRVYFNQIESIDGIKKRIESAFAMSAAKAGEGSTLMQAKRGVLAVKDFIENVNNGVENAVRLATYKNARAAGLTPARAASMAKNVTVNFNRRGTMGPAMNAAYLFFNASVQGTARIFKALRSSRVRKMVAGVMITSAMVELLNAMVSGDDDDGESFFDKIPEFEKGRNMIFMLPNGRDYIKIPMPYGYNVFWSAGRTAAEIARRGGDRWKESTANLLSDALDAFNPVGGASSLLNLIAPTVVDPIVDLTTNRDFTGRKIMPDQPAYAPPEPDNQRYWGSVGTHWRAISTFLNDVSGGDDVQPGAIDVSPETLEYMSGTVIGAAGAFLDRMVGLVSKGVDPEEDVTANDLPFARKVKGSKPAWYDKGAFYDRVAAVDLQVQYAKNYIEAEKMDEARAFVDGQEKILSLEPEVKSAKREMRSIRKARKANDAAFDRGKIDQATHSAEKAVVDEAERRVVLQFNTRWNEVMTGGE